DHFYPEILDPLDSNVLDEGDNGELVFTSLTKQALPIIRYRTKDLTSLRPGTAHPAFRRMDKVTGRSDDLIILRGVNVYPTQIEEIVLGTEGVAPHFQLRLSNPDRRDELAVLVEARDGTAAHECGSAANRITTRLKEAVIIREET